VTKLLVAVDESTHADDVCAVAAKWAVTMTADVVLLHARVEQMQPRGLPDATETGASADELLVRLADAMRAAGVTNVEPRVDTALAGDEVQVILDTAADVGADGIVIGHRGTSRLTQLLIGSVAHKLIQLADRPVLVVR